MNKISSRTSYNQFLVMVDFMEKYGDLSRPHTFPQGRLWCIQKWKELGQLLNSQDTEESRSEENWQHAGESVDADQNVSVPEDPKRDNLLIVQSESSIIADEDWNTPGSSNDLPPTPPMLGSITPPRSTSPQNSTSPPQYVSPPKSPVVPHKPTFPQTPPQRQQRKRKLSKMLEEVVVKCNENARQDNREREELFLELERERIRQRDIELRQRDTELQLQAQWLEFMKSALNVLQTHLSGK